MSTKRRRKATAEAEFDVGTRLREIREAHGLSQRELAERARAPHGQISMIERNHSSPSVASLRKILSGIPMTMAEFFESEPSPRRAAQVFFTPSELIDLTSRLSHRNGSGAQGSPGTGAQGTLSLRQVGDARAHGLQVLHEVYEPGADTGASMLEHDASEGGIVVSGEIEITVGTETRVLKAGDAFIFNSRRPHRFRNLSDRPAVLISACSPPYL